MMWVLLLNDMRSSHFEDVHPVFRAETREELDRLLQSEKVSSYRDGRWAKSFRQGGPLEWFNYPYDNPFRNVGTREDWMNDAGKRYDSQIEVVPYVLPPDGTVSTKGENEQ